MNKQELIAEAASKSGLSRTDITKALEAILATIMESMKKGGEVRLLNFGTFSVSNRASKEARNPRTNEPIHVPASRHPKFKAGKTLKKALN